jgi:hypothetical protein
MSENHENFIDTEGMDLDLLRSLIAQQALPECLDQAYMTKEDWDAFHADMQAMPVELPTDAEILAMAGLRD